MVPERPGMFVATKNRSVDFVHLKEKRENEVVVVVEE